MIADEKDANHPDRYTMAVNTQAKLLRVKPFQETLRGGYCEPASLKYVFYEISIKLLLHHQGKVLILRTRKNDIDLPGGRIEKGEERAPLKKLTEREIKEELGTDVRYNIKEPLFWYRGRSKYGC